MSGRLLQSRRLRRPKQGFQMGRRLAPVRSTWPIPCSGRSGNPAAAEQSPQCLVLGSGAVQGEKFFHRGLCDLSARSGVRLVANNSAPRHRVCDQPPPGPSTFLKAMRTDPPRLLLDTSTGNVHDYQYFPMRSVPAVRRFVHHHYRRVGFARGVAVYRLTGAERGNYTRRRVRPPSRRS